jgi:CRISPR/Cas system CSM-associated protein Csm5 (group 7 of RAMP superfamily)
MSDTQLNTNYDIALEILTPVHVGTDSNKLWMKFVDFFLKDGQIYIINQNALYQELMNLQARGNQSGLDYYMSLLTKGHFDAIEKYIKDEVDLDLITEHTFEYSGDLPSEIRPLVRTGTGTSYIPGSSIKGAIRSVLFNYLYNRSNERLQDRNIDRLVLGDFSNGIMRFIRPYDVEMPETEISNIDLFNLYSSTTDWKSNWKDRFSITAETFKIQQSKGTFRFNVADGLARQIKEKAPETLFKHLGQVIKNDTPPIQFIFNLINEYTYEHLQKEIDFFERYPEADDSEFVIENLKKLQEQTINNPDSCVLRLAYGSGFHGITGDWRFDNHTETIEKPDTKNMVYDQTTRQRVPARYKSRKVAGVELMGFVKLHLPIDVPRITFNKKVRVNKPIISNTTTEKVAEKIVIEQPKTAKQIDFKTLGQNATIYAEVLKIGKPFCEVKLLLDNYAFDLTATMSGTKKATIKVGDTVKVIVNSQTSEGKINTVKYLK